jgi:uncharacterized protein (DUF427 family)
VPVKPVPVKPVPVKPKEGQESVWDYPRPPRLEPCHQRIEITSAGVKIVNSSRSFRVLETSHPPVYYIPPEDIKLEFLRPTGDSRSVCEWKGEASYYDLRIGDRVVSQVAWFYPNPSRSFSEIRNHVAFYAARVVLLEGDGCFVDGEAVTPQPGGFYGGWITSNVVGPFKGEPGTMGW